MKSSIKIVMLFAVAFSAVSCFQKRHRNYEYFPDMYTGVSYETYGEYGVFEKEMEAKSPAEGTIPRGWMPYAYPDTNEGYEEAKTDLMNPLPYTEDNVNEGKVQYTTYCAICHGDKGDGKGTLATREKILGIPAYNDAGRAITEGSIYHVIYYGKNAMGSYAGQVSEKERWQIIMHVIDLKRALDGQPERDFEENPQLTEEGKRVTLTMSERRMNFASPEKSFDENQMTENQEDQTSKMSASESSEENQTEK